MTREIIQTDGAPAAIGTYSQAVRVSDTVYLSGQIALDTSGQIVGDTVLPFSDFDAVRTVIARGAA